MPQIVVTIDGKAYRMACAEGEEEHLLSLGADLDGRVATLRQSFGEIGDQRLIVMAAIMTMDELSETRARVDTLERRVAELQGGQDQARNGREVLIETMNGVSEAIEKVALKLERAAERS
jgi:cell division protein ZapA